MLTRDFVNKSADAVAGAVCAGSLFFAFCVVGWQLLKWLKSSEWHAVPVASAFRFLELDLTSVYAPSGWTGLAKIAQWFLDLPLSLVLPTVVVFLAYLCKALVCSKTIE